MHVLVATNVAARGLDLPDIGIVVHADLPENAEALTHRSGRTGRAGNKGVNLFLVEKGARRRAERLFADAHLKLSWTAPPDAAAVAAHDRARLVGEVAAAVGVARDGDVVAMAEKLVADHDAVAVVALLVERALAGRPAGEKLTRVELRPSTPSFAGRGDGARGSSSSVGVGGGGRRPPSSDMVAFEVNLGAKDRAEANWILPLVCRRGGITRREVGAIRVARECTYFEVAREVAEEFTANAGEPDPRAPHVRITPSSSPMPPRSFTPPPSRTQGPRTYAQHARPSAPHAHARPSSAPHARPSSAPHARPSAPPRRPPSSPAGSGHGPPRRKPRP